jgi:hypothetical protein
MNPTLVVDNTYSRSDGRRPTGALGGLLCGAIVGVFFGGTMGILVVLPKALRETYGPFELLLGGLIIGMIFGPVPGVLFGSLVGGFNRRWNGAKKCGPAIGSAIGVILGVVATAILMWHRLNLDPN